MMRFSFVLAGIVAMTCAASLPGLGAPAATKPAGGMMARVGPFPAQFVQMERAVKLTAEQKEKLKGLIDGMNRELEDFRVDALKKSKDAIAAIKTKEGAERDKLRQQLQEEMRAENAEYRKRMATDEAQIDALLTADQRLEWETAKLNDAILPRLGGDLSDAQRGQVKTMVEAAAKEVVEAKDADAAFAVSGKLFKKLVGEVLSEEQAARLFSPWSPSINGFGAVPGPKAAPVDKNLP